MIEVATPAERWRHLSTLLAALEGAVVAAARLDAHGPRPHRPGRRRADHVAFDTRLTALGTVIDAELDRLTAELLTAQLLAKQKPPLAASMA